MPFPPALTLGPSKRLRHGEDYRAVFDAKMRKSRGPLSGFSRPNGLARYRLGLAVGKSVGNAVERHRAKRLVREAFRQCQHELPRADSGAYDLVVSVRGRCSASLAEVQAALAGLAALLHAEWQRRSDRHKGAP